MGSCRWNQPLLLPTPGNVQPLPTLLLLLLLLLPLLPTLAATRKAHLLPLM
jgi:hypothetical protein